MSSQYVQTLGFMVLNHDEDLLSGPHLKTSGDFQHGDFGTGGAYEIGGDTDDDVTSAGLSPAIPSSEGCLDAGT